MWSALTDISGTFQQARATSCAHTRPLDSPEAVRASPASEREGKFSGDAEGDAFLHAVVRGYNRNDSDASAPRAR